MEKFNEWLKKEKEVINENFDLNFDDKKSIRNKKEWNDFIDYEQRIWNLRKLAFEAGYDITINSRSGKFDVYEYDTFKKIKTIDSVNSLKKWLLDNYKTK